MQFPYERYETLAEPLTVYYPTGEETLARWVFQTIERAGTLLSQLLDRPMPDLEILLVDMADWHLVPCENAEEVRNPHPDLTDVTSPPCMVVPTEIDPIFGTLTRVKPDIILYHEVTSACEESHRPA